MVPEPKATGVTFPYERQAMNGEEMPCPLEYPDQILYLSLRMLYAQLKQGTIDRATGTREKKQLMEEYRQNQFAESLLKECAEQIKRTELARAEYRKNRTLENADKLLACLEGGKP